MSRYLQANHETYQANYKLQVSGNYFHNRFKKYFQALTGFFPWVLQSCPTYYTACTNLFIHSIYFLLQVKRPNLSFLKI